MCGIVGADLDTGNAARQAADRGALPSEEFAIRETMKLQFRGEFFNFTNTPRFAFPDVGIGSGTFGQVTSTAPGSTPRHTQFGLRFEF